MYSKYSIFKKLLGKNDNNKYLQGESPDLDSNSEKKHGCIMLYHS